MDILCVVCGDTIIGQIWDNNKLKNDSVNHHITYFPEKTITIHRKCHGRKKLDLLGLIQYTQAEYHFFYEKLDFLEYSLPLPVFEKKKRKRKLIRRQYNPNYDKYLKPLITR